jgi:GT2 family glycosyltransferase
MTQVTVIIPHYNDLQGLSRCLDALARQTYPAEHVEIVVADNNSPVERRALEDAIGGRARLVVVNERGAGPARNGGVVASSGSVVAFTDSDCVPNPDWLAEAVLALQSGDIVGGRMKVLVRDPEKMTPTEAFERVFAFDNERYVKQKQFTVTANMICRRTTLATVGDFRVGVSEDVEWCHRARGLGFSLCYAPGAVVGHPARETWPELKRKWVRMNRETYQFYKQGSFGSLRWLLRTALLPFSAIAHVPRALTHPELTSARQRLLAIAVLFRIRFWRTSDALRLMWVGSN